MNAALTSNTRARVTVELEVQIGDNWTPDATIEQIHKQAIQSALQRLNEILRNGAKIIGHPKVTLIMVDAKDAY